MSTLGSMSTAISGLEAYGQQLAIVSDNIVNASTVGFKSSRGEFQSVLADAIGGSATSNNQAGRGTRIGGVTGQFTQGNIKSTERGTDLAVTGNGFFVLDSSAKGRVYTRDGAFRFDKEGWLTSLDGAKVQAYQASPEGTITGKLGDLRIPFDTIPAKPSNKIQIHMNLDARKLAMPNFDPRRPDETSQFTTATQVFDSVGNAHAVQLYFNKSSEGSWEWRAMIDGADIDGGNPEEKMLMAEGELEFDQLGQLMSSSQSLVNTSFSGGAIPDQELFFDFGDSLDEEGTGQKGTTQYGSKSATFRNVQDGFSAGQLLDTGIDSDGIVRGIYTNGLDRVLGQVALARFEATERLGRTGENQFKENMTSGQAIVGKANDNGIGGVLNRSLEQSNVDIAKEFVTMIQAQRGFQASAKSITTANEMLGEVMSFIK